MNNDFKILIDFLDRFGPEATAHQLPEPHTDAAAKLERFARGECNAAERAEICSMLRLHPAWLRWLADRVRLACVLDDGDGESAESAHVRRG